MVLTLWTCQKSSLYERLAGTAGVEPAFSGFGDRLPIRWLIPKKMKTAPRGFPWGGCRQVPLDAYTATPPPIRAAPVFRAAPGCEIGLKYPARFGVCHVVIYPWYVVAPERAIVFTGAFLPSSSPAGADPAAAWTSGCGPGTDRGVGDLRQVVAPPVLSACPGQGGRERMPGQARGCSLSYAR